MGLLSSFMGSSNPRKKRKSLKKPKANATIKQLESYVEKRTNELNKAVRRVQLKQAVEKLYSAKPEDFLKSRKAA